MHVSEAALEMRLGSLRGWGRGKPYVQGEKQSNDSFPIVNQFQQRHRIVFLW